VQKTAMYAALMCAASMCTFVSAPASAGLYTDEVAKCLVSSSSEADKNELMRWMFGAMSVHPAVKSIAKVSDAQRKVLSQNMAKLVDRLITVSCKSQVQEAIKYEGNGVFEQSFRVLGEVAGRGLFADPAVAASVAEYTNYLDKQKLEKMFGKM